MLLKIKHVRKGTFNAIAVEDFDTDTEEFYPVVLATDEFVSGAANDWNEGENIPCRGDLCKVEIIEAKS